MVNQRKSVNRKAAIITSLFSQVNRSPELTKILILLLVWGNVRSRSGYTTVEAQAISKSPQQKSITKKKGFSVKRPRERFL
jgi:hypothetical protein